MYQKIVDSVIFSDSIIYLFMFLAISFVLFDKKKDDWKPKRGPITKDPEGELITEDPTP